MGTINHELALPGPVYVVESHGPQGARHREGVYLTREEAEERLVDGSSDPERRNRMAIYQFVSEPAMVDIPCHPKPGADLVAEQGVD